MDCNFACDRLQYQMIETAMWVTQSESEKFENLSKAVIFS